MDILRLKFVIKIKKSIPKNMPKKKSTLWLTPFKIQRSHLFWSVRKFTERKHCTVILKTLIFDWVFGKSSSLWLKDWQTRQADCVQVYVLLQHEDVLGTVYMQWHSSDLSVFDNFNKGNFFRNNELFGNILHPNYTSSWWFWSFQSARR